MLFRSAKRLIRSVKRLLSRWSNQQEAALWQMTNRKTMGKRLAGYGKSERVEAKFFLLALSPTIPLMLSDMLDWERGFLWKAWMCLCIAWALGIMFIMFASLWRSFGRSMRDWRNGR